jgi:hypothetical protein
MLPSTMASGGIHPAQKADLFDISETPKLGPVVGYSQEGKKVSGSMYVRVNEGAQVVVEMHFR